MRRRLYLKIYLAFVTVLLGCILTVGIAAHTLRDGVGPVPGQLVDASWLILEGLPTPGAPDFDAALADRAERLGVELTLRSGDGALIAATGEPLPATDSKERACWVRHAGKAGLVVPLADGGQVGLTMPTNPHDHWRRFLATLVLLGLVIALGCLPVARGITRRIERLQEGVERFGSGDLAARVDVRGQDEVARLAGEFNRAAERIEGLVARQKRVLASASHELRSPLARLRMALELLDPGDDGERRDYLVGAVQDIEELDELIEHLLLTARIEAGGRIEDPEPVDLAALLASEAARTGATVHDAPATVPGDRRMLGLLLRNLLENARRHGGEAPAEARIVVEGSRVRIDVEDRGPGVPADQRERVFEPFYRPDGHREGGGGVGLGLALAREIARHHGGDVTCEDRPGGGSRFVVTLLMEG
jgi:two-component system, OmpR family, sensor kinase